MGFFSKLLSRDDWKQTLVRDLTLLSAIDGEMDNSEARVLFDVALNELHFSEAKLKSLMQNLGDVKNIYPTDDEDKFQYMLTLIRMTYADGFIDDNEIEFMKIIASKMNLPEDSVIKAIAIIEKELA
jgi:hypothetical protein